MAEFLEFLEDVYHTVQCHWNHHVYVQALRQDSTWCMFCGISPDEAKR